MEIYIEIVKITMSYLITDANRYQQKLLLYNASCTLVTVNLLLEIVSVMWSDPTHEFSCTSQLTVSRKSYVANVCHLSVENFGGEAVSPSERRLKETV